MALLGKTAVVIYSNYPKELREEHSRFHSYEHLLERVSTPGFLRGRRCNALDESSPSVFTLYEVNDRSVTLGGEYIYKLNNPTPWTAKFRPLADYASRTLCEVVASKGWGTGSHTLTVRFAPEAGREAELHGWICDVLVPALAPDNTRIAVHFLKRDRSIERPVTQEEILCRQGAGSQMQSDWLLIVEGWEEDVLRALCEGELSPAQLRTQGASAEVTYDFYALSHVLTHEEFVPPVGIGWCASGQMPAIGTESSGDPT